MESHDLLRHNALNLVRSDSNLGQVTSTSNRNFESRVKIDCHTQPKLETEFQVMFEKIKNKRLDRIIDDLNPKSMNLTPKKVTQSPKKNALKMKNELRSICK